MVARLSTRPIFSLEGRGTAFGHMSLPVARVVLRTVAKAGGAQTAVALTVPKTWESLRLRMGAQNLPHPDKASYGGEDAWFTSDVGGGALGVADGVGGWAEEGINPADYSKTFMATAKRFLEGEVGPDGAPVPPPADDAPAPAAQSGEWMGGGAAVDPVADVVAAGVGGALDAAAGWVERLRAGAQASSSAAAAAAEPSVAQLALDVAHRTTRLPGSATACVLRLDPGSGTLDAANLGDSGFLLLRGGRVAFRSPALQHFFDCPFQFAAVPEHAEVTDSVDDSEVYRLAVQPGDVIVLGSDGLLDNCQVEEILELAPRAAAGVQAAADALAALARLHAEDPTYESPYTQDALAEGLDLPLWQKVLSSSFEGGEFRLGKLRGGKQDDITVLVAYVEAA